MRIFFLTILLSLIFLQGCATPASPTGMVISAVEPIAQKNQALQNAVAVRSVSGGKETSPLGRSQVDSSGFSMALTQSLYSIGYAAGKVESAKLIIDAELVSLSQPLFGLTFDVTSSVVYKVEGTTFKRTFPITAIGTARTSDAFLADERMRIANERSIKENITQFLRELSLSYKE